MANILRDYVMPVTIIPAAPPADLGFIRRVLFIGKPSDTAVTGVFKDYLSADELAADTTDADVAQFFNAGMNRVYGIMANTLADANDAVLENMGDFFTIVIGAGFVIPSDLSGLTSLDSFQGVLQVVGANETIAAEQAAIERRVGYYMNHANLYFAVGSLVSQPTLSSIQYLVMPQTDNINTLSRANALFEDRISFTITDDTYQNRLGFYACGGIAIHAPYVQREIQVLLQTEAFNFIYTNKPAYNEIEAKKIQAQLQKIIDRYIDNGQIDLGDVNVEAIRENFVMDAQITVQNPTATWKNVTTLRQTNRTL